jgi:hypothetical protein
MRLSRATAFTIAVIRIRLKSPIAESPEPGPRVATRGPQRVEDGRLDADEALWPP